jgi:hypothetical protein
MKNEKLKKSVTVNSNESTSDIINQSLAFDNNSDAILSLGYTGYRGNTPVKEQNDVWNMSVGLTSFLHMSISEATKPKRERNAFKMIMGLKMALNQADIIYKSHPNSILTHEISGNDISLSLGYTGLLGAVSYADLPFEKKKNMYYITKSFRVLISEVMKPDKVRDNNQINAFLAVAVQQAEAFHKNNKGVSLFHDLNEPK